ncbi:MAG: hypothetical protein KC547_15165 [Anaerolineae bacterium]|nr:hypothetical protein [Anaerolineae bacterium]
MDLRMQPGFLGTGASMLADLTLLAYILLLVPAMLIGFFYARRKRFDSHHKPIMTAITLVNWLLIIFLMFVSYQQGVLPSLSQNLNNPRYLLPTLHLVIGGLAQIVATYLVIRMWFEKQLPGWFKVSNIKRFMRFALAGWLIAALLGIAIYVTWYAASTPSDPAAPVSAESTPEATPEVTPDAAPEATPEVTAEPASG